jgi:hypothetical protein
LLKLEAVEAAFAVEFAQAVEFAAEFAQDAELAQTSGCLSLSHTRWSTSL